MLTDAGLAGTALYKHQLMAPGLYTGYSAEDSSRNPRSCGSAALGGSERTGKERNAALASLAAEAGSSFGPAGTIIDNVRMIVETQVVRFDSLPLDCGVTLAPVDVAYETYGELNAAKSNAILMLHAFSGDAHAAGISHDGGKPGWWDNMIGPGKAFDTTSIS